MAHRTEHARCVAATGAWCEEAERLLAALEARAQTSPRVAALYARARSLRGDLLAYHDLARQQQAMATLGGDDPDGAAAERALQIMVRAAETFGELQAVRERAERDPDGDG